MKDAALEPFAAAPERNAEYAIYKPNSRGKGAVLRLGLNRAKKSIFVDAALQSGEKQFDWENKITMKWTLSDVGVMLATLQGRQSEGKLFHQSEKGNSTFDLTRQEDPQRAPYLAAMGKQDATDKSTRRVIIPLSHSEAAILETALRAAITRMLGW